MTDAAELTSIRLASEADLPAMVRIYNESIPGGWSTADLRPVTVEERRPWFRRFSSDKRPAWVAEIEGQVTGMAYLTSFYEGRPAYDATAEISVYVDRDRQRCGIGRQLKQFVISQCPRLGITHLISMAFDHNQATRRLNERLGFEIQGHLKDIAQIGGRKRGLIISVLEIAQSPDHLRPSGASASG